jgi:predicted O-methyltransferase YrrM
MLTDYARSRWLKFSEEHPWPATRPKTEWTKMHGWLSDGTMQMIAAYQPADECLILELGSWFGKSSLFMLHRNTKMRMICVDNWKGSPEIAKDNAEKIPGAFDAFRYHVWPQRARVVAVKADTVDGMIAVEKAGLNPDFVYVDAGHEFMQVLFDISTARNLFAPDVRLVGDDFDKPEVRRAVEAFCRANSDDVRSVRYNKKAWTIEM